MLRFQVTIPQWLELPQEIRQRLKKIFAIPKSAGCQVVDNQLVSDGHTHADLANLTIEKMQDYLGMYDETDFWHLYDLVLQDLFQARQDEIDTEIAVAKAEQEVLEASKTGAIAELAKQMQALAQNNALNATHVSIEAKPKRGRPKKT